MPDYDGEHRCPSTAPFTFANRYIESTLTDDEKYARFIEIFPDCNLDYGYLKIKWNIDKYTAIAALLPFLYKKGLKAFRILISILCPIGLTIIFSIMAVAELAMGPERAADYNKNFSSLTQDEKNTFYTQEDLQKATKILFPEFDVIKHSIEVIGPDSGLMFTMLCTII